MEQRNGIYYNMGRWGNGRCIRDADAIPLLIALYSSAWRRGTAPDENKWRSEPSLYFPDLSNSKHTLFFTLYTFSRLTITLLKHPLDYPDPSRISCTNLPLISNNNSAIK